MNYQLIRKIHLYACLSIVAVLFMFIITSYLMIHHTHFHGEPIKTSDEIILNEKLNSEAEWAKLLSENDITGRLTREADDPAKQIREYGSAESFSKLTYDKANQKVAIERTRKAPANALIGIHRLRGYRGSLPYLLYALLLDIVGLSLIIFTITGVIMWFKLLKKDKYAWIIFIAGFVYFITTMVVLMVHR